VLARGAEHVEYVEYVEYVEDVPGAAHKAEHLGDVHGVARPRVRPAVR